jgi:hypothetical protein
VNNEERLGLANREDVRIIAELKGKLLATETELERTRRQRDYVLRLLRQQQTLTTLRGQNSVLAQLLSRVPRGLKDIIPMRVKQLALNIAVKIG